nr:hypothetical protein [Mesorhizobium sp.]
MVISTFLSGLDCGWRHADSAGVENRSDTGATLLDLLSSFVAVEFGKEIPAIERSTDAGRIAVDLASLAVEIDAGAIVIALKNMHPLTSEGGFTREITGGVIS